MAYREFIDDAGVAWTVWDTYPEPGQCVGMPDLCGGWLTFEAGPERRRLVPAPAGWSEETDSEIRTWLPLAAPANRKVGSPRQETGKPIEIIRTERLQSHLAISNVVPEDVRSLIDKSRRTIEDLERALDDRPTAYEFPARRADDLAKRQT